MIKQVLKPADIAKLVGITRQSIYQGVSDGRYQKLECARKGSDGRCLGYTVESVEKEFGIKLEKSDLRF